MERKVKLDNGFECTIDDIVLDDWELTEMVAEIDGIQRAGDDATEAEQVDGFRLTTAVFKKLLGRKGYEALKNHVRTDDGRVPAEAMQNLIEELFVKLGEPGKN